MNGRSFRQDLRRAIAPAAPRLGLCRRLPKQYIFVKLQHPGALITASERAKLLYKRNNCAAVDESHMTMSIEVASSSRIWFRASFIAVLYLILRQ